MRLLTLKTKDFRVLSGDRDFDFADGLTGITGPNGAGKSTLVNAVAYALYGPDMLRSGSVDVTTWGAKKASVELSFEFNGLTYKIERNPTDAKLTVQSEDESEHLVSHGRDPVTKAVADLLKVDKDGFLVSVFARQKELAYISSLQPQVRMTTILRLLNINQINKAIKNVRELASGIRRELDGLRYQQADVVDLKKMITEFNQALVSAKDQIDEYDKEVASAAGSVVAAYAKADALAKRREQELVKWQEYSKIDGELATLWAQSVSQATRLEIQLRDMKNSCPLCKRPFDNAEEIESERGKLKDAIDSYIGDTDQIAIERQQVKSEWEPKLQPVDPKEDQEARSGLSDANSALSTAKMNLAVAQSKVATIEHNLNLTSTQYANAEALGKRIKTLEVDAVAHETASKELNSMKERMIGRIIPALNERASRLVEKMTEGKYSELALTPDYDIQFRNSQGELKGFVHLSGGEQTIFALALRLAISDLRAENIGVLFLDEVMSDLSSEDGRDESTWQTLESLSDKYNQIFVISHVAAFKDRAPSVIRLV